MQQQDSVSPLSISRDGLLFLSGHQASLRVHRGHLVARSGSGPGAAEARFARGARERIRRVVVLAKGGYTTWEALAWLHGVGASFLCLDRSGEVVAFSGHPGPDQAALRRAQALGLENGTALEVARYLIGNKLDGQARVAESLPDPERAVAAILRARQRVRDAERLQEVLAAEAKGAAAYWKAWENVSLNFAVRASGTVPLHWMVVGDRHSPLSSSPRLAVTSAGAILNYLYALAEFECRVTLLAIGLDPGIGWFHRDTAYRDSAALDLMESVRPDVDAYLLGLLRSRTFSRREFIELPNGHVRVTTALARLLTVSSLPLWERAAAAPAEDIAVLVAGSAASGVRVRTRLTQADRKRGRKPNGRGRAVPSACRLCGRMLDDADRSYCGSCIPAMEAERTKRLAGAGKTTLARMRASPEDPAQSIEARERRTAKVRAQAAAIREWERVNGRVRNPEHYDGVILPLLQRMSVKQLASLSGLSERYCWRVKKGQRRLHPRFWDLVQAKSGLPGDTTNREGMSKLGLG